MFYRSAIALACLGVAAAGTVMSTAMSGAEPATGSACPDQVTFAVGGTGDTHSQFVPGVPAGPRVNIEYPASIRPVGDKTGNDSIVVGAHQLDAQARAYRVDCPETHINAQGYSLGAVVVSDVCDDWQSDAVMNSNTACTTVGNPTRPQRNGASGILSQIPDVVPGLTPTAHVNAGPIPITEVCNSNDIICNAPNPVVNPLEFANGVVGYFAGDHGYPQPIPPSPGDHMYNQQPRLEGAAPTSPALQTLHTVPTVLDAVENGVPQAPAGEVAFTEFDVAELIEPQVLAVVPVSMLDLANRVVTNMVASENRR